MSTYLAGFSLGLSLILAIGSQNAFVLKQGLKKRHVFIVCLVCAVSDGILISLGVAGFGTVVKQFPTIEIVARYGGAAFLTIYALLSFKSAFTQTHALEAEAETESSLFKTDCHLSGLYLVKPPCLFGHGDSVGVGFNPVSSPAVSVCSGCGDRVLRVSSSAWAYGARVLAPVFENPKAWKVFEFLVGIIMLALALSLVANV